MLIRVLILVLDSLRVDSHGVIVQVQSNSTATMLNKHSVRGLCCGFLLGFVCLVCF